MITTSCICGRSVTRYNIEVGLYEWLTGWLQVWLEVSMKKLKIFLDKSDTSRIMTINHNLHSSKIQDSVPPSLILFYMMHLSRTDCQHTYWVSLQSSGINPSVQLNCSHLGSACTSMTEHIKTSRLNFPQNKHINMEELGKSVPPENSLVELSRHQHSLLCVQDHQGQSM